MDAEIPNNEVALRMLAEIPNILTSGEIEQVQRLALDEPLTSERARRLYTRIGRTLGWTDERIDEFLEEREREVHGAVRSPSAAALLITCEIMDVLTRCGYLNGEPYQSGDVTGGWTIEARTPTGSRFVNVDVFCGPPEPPEPS